jgi:hypothetical protein
MASEKATYWMVLGVLALAAANGLVTGYSGWAERLADRSIALVDQVAPGIATNANLGMLNRDDQAVNRMVSAQVRVARVQSAIRRRQAEAVRVQVNGIRTRVMEHGMRAVIDCPQQNFVIDIPQAPQILEDSTF